MLFDFFSPKIKLDLVELRKVFDNQRKTLLNLGYPELLGLNAEQFQKETEAVWKDCADKHQNATFVQRGTIPLLLVATVKNINKALEKIHGHTDLEIPNIKMNTSVDDHFYILLDVEDGERMIAKSPKESLKRFSREKRSPLNIHESIALLTHYPHILTNHYVITAGSSLKKDKENMALLWQSDENNNLQLHYAWFDIAHGNYGTASCGAKIFIIKSFKLYGSYPK